jgi:hypothetical protein
MTFFIAHALRGTGQSKLLTALREEHFLVRMRPSYDATKSSADAAHDLNSPLHDASTEGLVVGRRDGPEKCGLGTEETRTRRSRRSSKNRAIRRNEFRPNIMSKPMTLAMIEVIGKTVSGPKYAKRKLSMITIPHFLNCLYLI